MCQDVAGGIGVPLCVSLRVCPASSGRQRYIGPLCQGPLCEHSTTHRLPYHFYHCGSSSQPSSTWQIMKSIYNGFICNSASLLSRSAWNMTHCATLRHGRKTYVCLCCGMGSRVESGWIHSSLCYFYHWFKLYGFLADEYFTVPFNLTLVLAFQPMFVLAFPPVFFNNLGDVVDNPLMLCVLCRHFFTSLCWLQALCVLSFVQTIHLKSQIDSDHVSASKHY